MKLSPYLYLSTAIVPGTAVLGFEKIRGTAVSKNEEVAAPSKNALGSVFDDEDDEIEEEVGTRMLLQKPPNLVKNLALCRKNLCSKLKPVAKKKACQEVCKGFFNKCPASKTAFKTIGACIDPEFGTYPLKGTLEFKANKKSIAAKKCKDMCLDLPDCTTVELSEGCECRTEKTWLCDFYGGKKFFKKVNPIKPCTTYTRLKTTAIKPNPYKPCDPTDLLTQALGCVAGQFGVTDAQQVPAVSAGCLYCIQAYNSERQCSRIVEFICDDSLPRGAIGFCSPVCDPQGNNACDDIITKAALCVIGQPATSTMRSGCVIDNSLTCPSS